MSQRLTQQQLQSLAAVAVVPNARPEQPGVDRRFGLPTGLYAATVLLYLAFIAIMAGVFMNRELAIPIVIFAGFVVMAFGLAGCWTRMKPDNTTPAPTWGQFAAHGIDTPSGRLSAGQAAAQVLVLPVLIVVWGLAIAVIVAFT